MAQQNTKIGLVVGPRKWTPSEALAFVNQYGWDFKPIFFQRKFNWSPQNVKTFIKRHGPPTDELNSKPLRDSLPAPKSSPAPKPVAAPPAPTPDARPSFASWAAAAPATILRWLLRILLLTVAARLAWAGLTLNYRYGLTLAPAFAPDVGPTIASILVCYDAMTIFLPTWGKELWRSRKRGAAVIAWLACLPAVVMTLYSSANFFAANVDESRESRRLVIEQRQQLTSHLEEIRARARALEQRPIATIATEIETALQAMPATTRLQTKDCTDVTIQPSRNWCNAVSTLRKKKDEAAGRIDLEHQAAKVEADLAALPPIVSVNPGGEALSSAGVVDERVGRETQKGLLTGAPLLAGILIWLAF